MRHSLLLRLLGLSLAVASLAVAATALLATHGTGSQLRAEVESSASLLETDSGIYSDLLRYASENSGWDGVESLVGGLAEQTGRRIVLTTAAGVTIVDSAALLGDGSGDPPSIPSARIDATTALVTNRVLLAGATGPASAVLPDGPAVPTDYTWQQTDAERQERQRLAEQATACLEREGIEVRLRPATRPLGGGLYAPYTATAENGPQALTGRDAADLLAHPCVPDELNQPSAAAFARNERTVELATACLDERGLAYEMSVDSYGMRIVEPADGETTVPQAWLDCYETARIEATRPYVAPPADLYLGTSDRFDVFSADGWRRTAATAAMVFAVAAAVTVLAGRRLVRPILALTTAARRMATGDHTTRVPARGNDEVTRLAHAFNAMAESIQRNDKQRKALVNDVAHELRTPLANVRSLLEAAEYDVLPRDAALIASLREESTLLERLVSDLQDLALADAGMLQIHPEDRDAADLAGQAVSAHRARAEAAGVTIRLDAPAPVPVHADPARLRQALGNLVSNAVTHTPAGGTVTVAARRHDGAVVLTVADTGPGIDAEHLPHVFDRFYRADPSRSRATGGSGLGLAITKHLVEAHHGRIDAASTVGKGSVFTIELPGS